MRNEVELTLMSKVLQTIQIWIAHILALQWQLSNNIIFVFLAGINQLAEAKLGQLSEGRYL